MTILALKKLPDAELGAEFIRRAKALGEAVNLWLPAEKAAERLIEIEGEMKTRGCQFRMTLAPLLDSPDRIVQYYVARELLALVPERSRQIIEENSKQGDAIAGDAGMLLYFVDSGIYKPD